MHRAISLGLRALQLVTAVTVLGLAASMIKSQVFGTAPVTTRYSTFTGGFGLIVCGVGVIAMFMSFVPSIVPIGLDILAGLFFLGGGIAWAYGLRKTDNCSSPDGMLLNDLLNRGKLGTGESAVYGVYQKGDNVDSLYSRLRGICRQGQAGEILQFISFGIAAGLAVLTFFQGKRGGGGAGRYVA
ncbi:marvel domain-containing protein [Staphylotrichum tortipilum]|uniref:Marvel domain-containing protein n=1 Tax=Staphylotrichum tortipilum TaxID=2831512 RepID=A0AAN6RXE8_9PEZI|nr:marvel domain-containing protein [Staphylotrichum longicolle]